MKILVLQGSPNANGSTAILAREFVVGAREAGHDTLGRQACNRPGMCKDGGR